MGRVCEEVEGVTFSRELVAAISETTFKQCEVLATDLEQFARYRHLCFPQGGLEESHLMPDLVSQATPFTERGRVWSCCNYRVVATTETCHDQSDPHSS